VLELTALLDLFRLGVSPDDPAVEAGRRVMFNTVVTLGFLPNIPLLFVTEVEGGALEIMVGGVLVHLAVLGGLLVAQHYRASTGSVACVGVLWTLGYVTFLEVLLGKGRGGSELVPWALLILLLVLIEGRKGWLERFTIAATGAVALGLWLSQRWGTSCPPPSCRCGSPLFLLSR
jgi:hypothetical protein